MCVSKWSAIPGFVEVHVCLQAGMLLLVHGEVTSPDVDMFDREMVFIEKVLQPLLEQLPTLKVVLEHITTQHAVDFVRSAPGNIAATVTPQHMLLNRNALFQVGVHTQCCTCSPDVMIVHWRLFNFMCRVACNRMHTACQC